MGFKINALTGQFDLTGSGGGSSFFKDPVATEGALPATGADGEMRVVLSTDHVYVWDNTTSQWIDTGLNEAFVIGSTPNNHGYSFVATPNGNITNTTLVLQPTDATHPGIITNGAQTISGIKTLSNQVNTDGGIDRSTSGTLSIGASSNSAVINIGNSGATVNIQGTTLYENVNQLQVTDPLITLNKGGGTGSASASGFELEENNVITGYVKTSADRNSWELKAPNTAGIATITPGAGGITLNQSSHDPVTFAPVGSSPSANGATLSGQVITLQPADGTHPGLLTELTQTIGGAKTFSSTLTAANIIDSGLTADTVPYANGSKQLTSSAVTSTELGFLSGVTSAVQTQLNNKANITLNNLGTTNINSSFTFNTGSTVTIKTKDDATTATKSMILETGDATGFGSGSLTVQTGTADGGTGGLTLASGNATGTNASTGNVTLASGLPTGSGTSGGMSITTSATTSGTSGNVVITSGSATSGTSGNISINTGTVSGGTRGNLSLAGGGTINVNNQLISNVVNPVSAQDAATKNYVDNAAFANKTLSNLTSPTSINQSLIPSIDVNVDLGTALKRWSELYVTAIRNGSNLVVDISTQKLVDNSGLNAVDWTNRKLLSGATTKLDWSGTNLDINTRKIINVVDPTSAQDAATKNYVDTHSTASSAGDIAETSFSIANNQAAAANVTGFAFANGTVRSFKALVSIAIIATSSLYEEFTVQGIQRGADWQISVDSLGDSSLITFSITTAGQVQYTSGNYAGFSAGTMKFRAITTSV